ncbi:hypothetical protein BDM02DRAFT_3121675, partial [Thelephora ganbajun]
MFLPIKWTAAPSVVRFPPSPSGPTLHTTARVQAILFATFPASLRCSASSVSPARGAIWRNHG